FDDASALAHEGLAAATATEHAPVLARAHLELALVEAELGHEAAALAHATDAHFIATGTQQHGLAATAATVASDALPAESASRSVALLWHRAGTAAALRMHDGERALADVDIAYGTSLLRLQEMDDAAEALARGTAILRRRLGADAQEVWQAELMLARALVTGGRVDDAKALVEHAIAQVEPQLGDDPPRLATALASISELHQFTGDMDAAERAGARALALLDANLGADHPIAIDTRVNYAALLHRRRERERAAELLAQAVASCERIDDGPRRARSLHIQAIVLKQLKRYDEALAAETASSAWYRTHTPDAPRNLLLGALTIGNIQLLRDDYPAAEQSYREAIALVEQHGLVDREEAVYSDFANFLFQTGRATEAVGRWEALLAHMRAKDAARYDLAQYEFDLGRALWREGRDRERARAVVTAALAVLRSDPPTAQVGGHIRRDWTADELAKWLADPDAWERD
ncbi:MAG TPA: tetratricopeptide repeat protein, partial [Nannocystaceae bacterium]|nr:tetratricopeptide repeat protein [Nannocystaceae bacterium]